MSLHNYIKEFRQEIEKLEDYGYTESLEINEEIRANKLAVINANIVLVNGSSLHIKEYIDARYNIERISYAYHYQGCDGKCIFRYDNAHHKPAPGFKEHKHTKEGNIIEASLPAIAEIIDEVIKCM
ncbi:MAG: hypothetical protein JSV88_08535 [Candidatus Aminicenantes bacterium]|nr:MAG: hypothetical protein JSV88_08535 [Candidatus Aminicenantes bacterium]